ncbi:hypothetical protein [Deinococcus metallilatus]|uniref:Uncharacterized protein n=1 Tax=Deinococcus metallilatus TaxID=1211322 RepID=A0AAJ5K337_9DEIO|nr:hypothetical protein [Deinococcus metallilatus]MBB5297487.1 hypothetical protein [Deinococcus metallilatus]RXJ08046.1 hypothetical protein ERJ73_19540 [Deinococcus metallilatus]TLK20528.1 hypothetical protein FCS05_20085 [Deinococcus metallilatus]
MKHNSTNAAQRGENPHTLPAIVSHISPKGPRVVLADGRAVTVEDRNRDSGRKRYRLAIPRYAAALKRFGPDAVVYEYCLTFPAHLDVLDHEDTEHMEDTIRALAPDAFLKVEDSRTPSPLPFDPHGHFVSTVLLPDMPGLWRYPDPLDVLDMVPSSDTHRTLFGFFCYVAKPVLGGAERPTPEDCGRFTPDELARHEMAAQDRTDAARKRAQERGFKALPDSSGWVTGGKKRKGKRAA